MKNLITLLIMIIVFLHLGFYNSYCQDLKTEIRTPGMFTKLSVSGAYTVKLIKGDKESVKIIASPDLIELIKTEIKGDGLEIFNKRSISGSEKINIEVTYNELTALDLSGASNVEADSPVNSDKFDLDISGAGKINLKVNTGKLSVDMSGVANLSITGKATDQKLDLSGAGSYNAYELESETADIDISGVGSAYVFTTKNISAELSGVGSIFYKGKPEFKSINISGIGKIKSKD